MLWAGEPRTRTSWAVSEHSERIPAQAKCPRSNTRRDGLQSRRKKRTVDRAASLGITHKYAGWTDSRRYPTTWEVSVYVSHARHWQHSTRDAQVSMCNVETRECDGHVMFSGIRNSE
jgi:hypothetical protein